MAYVLGDEQWSSYRRLGFLRLGRVLDGDTHPDLEADPRVQELIRRPLFRDIAERHYGPHAGVSILPGMMTSEPAGPGRHRSWHQVGGDAWKLDRDPLVALWVSLDPAGRGSGGLQVIPGTHRFGLLDRDGGTLTPESARHYCPEEGITSLEVEAGEALLLHNWLVRRREDHPPGAPRRALFACYIDARTRSTLTGNRFPTVFESRQGPVGEWAFLERLRGELEHFRDTAREAERYALSLADYVTQLERARAASEDQVRSLEAELERARAAAAAPPRKGFARLPGVTNDR